MYVAYLFVVIEHFKMWNVWLVSDGETLLVVFGGRRLDETGTESTVLEDLWLYSFTTNTWREKPQSIYFHRSHQTMVMSGTRLWVFGGFVRSGASQTIYVFNDLTSIDLSNDTSSTERMVVSPDWVIIFKNS